jgi:DnaJ domain
MATMNITAMASRNSPHRSADRINARNTLDVVLDLYRNPAMAPGARHAPLPKDITNVIRLAAASDDEIKGMLLGENVDTAELRAASAFFIQQVLFQAGADRLRLLGLSPGATQQQIRDHKRLLLKWLHPDRNQNKWEATYFQRVMQAAKQLESEPPAADIAAPPRKHSRSGKRSRAHVPAHFRAPRQVDWRDLMVRALRRALMALAAGVSVIVAFAAATRAGWISQDLPLFRSLEAWLQ